MDTVSDVKHDLATNLRRTVEEADRLLKSAANTGEKAFDAARDKLSGQVREMTSRLDDLESAAIHRAKRAARSANHTVHEHPYGAMGVAAAVGLLIGFLAARR